VQCVYTSARCSVHTTGCSQDLPTMHKLVHANIVVHQKRTQLGSTALGASTRCGPAHALYWASAATSATVCTVLPSPISSASTPM
jgi:hypothetical protein